MTISCPYCHQPAIFTDSAEVYHGTSYGMVWICRPCNAYVGVHKAGTHRWENGVLIEHTGTEPLGTLADAATRKARKQAHAMFDGLWKHGHMNRSAAYAWLQAVTGLPEETCHIAHMNVDQCALVVKHCLNWAPTERLNKQRAVHKKASRRNSKPGVPTPRTDHSLPDCACPGAPWNHCAHTGPA